MQPILVGVMSLTLTTTARRTDETFAGGKLPVIGSDSTLFTWPSAMQEMQSSRAAAHISPKGQPWGRGAEGFHSRRWHVKPVLLSAKCSFEIGLSVGALVQSIRQFQQRDSTLLCAQL